MAMRGNAVILGHSVENSQQLTHSPALLRCFFFSFCYIFS